MIWNYSVCSWEVLHGTAVLLYQNGCPKWLVRCTFYAANLPQIYAATAKLSGRVQLPLQHCSAKCCCYCPTSKPTDDDLRTFTFTSALLLRVLKWKKKSAGECWRRVLQPLAAPACICLLPPTDFAVPGRNWTILKKDLSLIKVPMNTNQDGLKVLSIGWRSVWPPNSSHS